VSELVVEVSLLQWRVANVKEVELAGLNARLKVVDLQERLGY